MKNSDIIPCSFGLWKGQPRLVVALSMLCPLSFTLSFVVVLLVNAKLFLDVVEGYVAFALAFVYFLPTMNTKP